MYMRLQADEMGLGKSCQLCIHFGSLARLYNKQNLTTTSSTSSFSTSLHTSSLLAREHASAIFLVICPATVLQHWLREFRMWVPQMRAVILHSVSKTGGELCKLGDDSKYSIVYRHDFNLVYTCIYSMYISIFICLDVCLLIMSILYVYMCIEIRKVLRRVQRLSNTHAVTVLATYEGMRCHRGALTSVEWTAVCLDEGHKIRNPVTDVSSSPLLYDSSLYMVYMLMCGLVFTPVFIGKCLLTRDI